MPSTNMVHPKKSRSTKPKMFQCKGFGNCQMVFTRSEHLARHTRKHTGEKPYLCVVPGCTRKFSRFDNMMQHTQTHKLTRSKSPSLPPTLISSSSSTSTTSSQYEPEATPIDSSDEEGPIKSLCKLSPAPPLKELHLTQDEFEALQGFGRFRHTPILIDSFRDLASVVYIEPNPVRN